MNKITRLFAVLSLALVLGGCAGAHIDPNDKTVSLVYGYFDMKDAPSSLDWVSIKRYGSDEAAFYQIGASDGLFFHVGIAPGSYQIERFGGVGGIPLLTRRNFIYNFGTRGRNGSAIRVQRPDIYFMGTFKYVDHPGGFFKADKFEMQASKQPTEKEVLQRLIKSLESDRDYSEYTRQLGLAKRRLAELSK